MNFVSYRELVADVRVWSAGLPDDLVAVAGVPRSGILPATLLALHRNLHLVTLDDLAQGRSPWRKPLRRGVPARSNGRVLVIDDSLSAGRTLRQVRAALGRRSDVLFGAVYYDRRLPELADVVFRRVPPPRCFEWNLFHCDQVRLACLDMDGVICEDWTEQEEDRGEGLKRYLRHLSEARPLHVPTFPVLAVVTSRLEKYRLETIAWLGQHGVRFGELLMSPHPTAAARRAAGDHARRKAGWYDRRPEARLFIESDPRQAAEIARLCRRPVLCVAEMKLYEG